MLGDLPQDMIAADALIQIDTVIKHFLLLIWLATHHGRSALPYLLFYF
jgi:hypothetical protein